MTKKSYFKTVFCICAIMGFTKNDAQQVSNVINSWLGNTNANANTFYPQGIEDMFVATDGTIYSNVLWEEGGGNITAVKDGNISHSSGNFGWGRLGGSAIAANATYLYYAQIINSEGGSLVGNAWPKVGKEWFGISRRNRTNINTGNSFTEGKGGGGGTPAGTFLVVHELDEGLDGKNITGVYANTTELFVGCYDNKIRIYDANTMAYKRMFTVTAPHNIFIDAQGKLWVAIGFNATKIECYDVNGVKQAQEINLEAGSFVGDFCIDKDNRMLIGDVGEREQVLIYTNINNSPELTETFGTKYGIYSGVPGQMAPLKFQQVRGIGSDSIGNIYIGNTQWYTNGQGFILEAYSPQGNLNWTGNCVMFVDASSADAATNAKDIYGPAEHYKLDYSKPAGQEATLYGFTVNRYKYPADPRLKSKAATAYIRTFNNKKFLVTIEQSSGMSLCIYRFNAVTDGEVAIPCVMWGIDNKTFPNSPLGHWLWRDLNANGQMEQNEYITTEATILDGGYSSFIDNNLTVWFACGDIKTVMCTGLDANNIPQFSSLFETIAKPTPFIEVRRLRYLPGVDVMYLGGKTNTYPTAIDWYPMGRAIHRYNNWSAGNVQSLFEILPPFDGPSDCETQSFDVCGNYIFTAISRGNTSTIAYGEINVYNANNGLKIGRIIPPWTNIGWNDMVECLNVTQRADGEYVILQEEDGRNKNVMYRWCPTGNCVESDINITLTEPNTSITYLNYNSLSITANVQTDSSVISKVEFYANDSLLGFKTIKPYTFIWEKPTLGKNIIYAKAISTNNLKVTGNSILINISDGKPNTKLIISKSSYSLRDIIDLNVIATDVDGTIDSVMFFVGDSLLYTDKQLPWVYNWKGFNMGAKILRAKAVDNNGKYGLSDIIPVAITDSSIIDNTDNGWLWDKFELDLCNTCYKSAAHSASATGAWGEYTFTGTGIEAYCETWDGGGTLELFVDGVSKGLFAQNIEPFGGAQKFASITNLTNNKHLLKFISVNNAWVGIDYLRVISADTSTNQIHTVAEYKSDNVRLQINSADWKHFANNNHKAYGSKINSISNYFIIGNDNANITNAGVRKMSWIDGTPVDNNDLNTQRINITGIGNGLEFNVIANNDIDTLRLYVGGQNANGILIAQLSNNAAPDFVHSTNNNSENWDLYYNIIYNARQNGQYLKIKWIQSSGIGSINLQAASIIGKSEKKPTIILPNSENSLNTCKINVYPNPVTKVLYISNITSSAQISIFTIDGKLINKYNAPNENNLVNVEGWNKGLYIMHVQLVYNTYITKFEVK